MLKKKKKKETNPTAKQLGRRVGLLLTGAIFRTRWRVRKSLNGDVSLTCFRIIIYIYIFYNNKEISSPPWQ